MVLSKIKEGETKKLKWKNKIVVLYLNDSLYLAWKYALIFVRKHYLFQDANSFPKAEGRGKLWNSRNR